MQILSSVTMSMVLDIVSGDVLISVCESEGKYESVQSRLYVKHVS